MAKRGWQFKEYNEKRRLTQTQEIACRNCGTLFRLPKCRVGRVRCCSSACAQELVAKEKAASIAARTMTCVTCGERFLARWAQIRNTGAKYCSMKCAHPALIEASKTKEATERRVKSWLKNLRAGKVRVYSGPQHPRWSGGKKASYERNKKKAIAWTREYRKRNPHKVREFMERREGRKYGRLPKGTILRLMELQMGKCAVCRVGIKEKFHVDHIVPLARGGRHEKTNVQLLCPSCNCHKSAKDPITFMQQRGFLL